jgi:putative membrane protein
MNRALIICAAATAALSLAACNKNQATGNQSQATADTNATNTSTPGQSAPVNKAQDAAGAAVGSMSAATMGSHDTGAFVSNAVIGNMYEIEAAKIAEQKSKNADVKKFAKQMVTDHTKLGDEMKPVIAKAGQTPPTDLDQRHKGFLDNLKAASAADFDKTYMDQQVAAHDETLTLLQGYAKDGSDAGLKDAASKAVPMVQHHDDMAKQIQAKVAGGSKGANNAATTNP